MIFGESSIAMFVSKLFRCALFASGNARQGSRGQPAFSAGAR